MTKPKIEVKVRYNAICIFINEVLHLRVNNRLKLLGVQAWERRPEGKWIIEYVMDGATMESDYDDREKWLAVLDGLSRIL